MSTNKQAREELERIYGKGCMFKKAKIEEQIMQLKTIKTYKRFIVETKYTGKKLRRLEQNMTYHHLQHRSEGGTTDLQNGSVVNELAHRYIHSLPREQEEIINNMLRHYKLTCGILVPDGKGSFTVEEPLVINLDANMEDFITIQAYNTTPHQQENRKRFNRQREKRKTQKIIDEYYDRMYEEDEDEIYEEEPEDDERDY